MGTDFGGRPPVVVMADQLAPRSRGPAWREGRQKKTVHRRLAALYLHGQQFAFLTSPSASRGATFAAHGPVERASRFLNAASLSSPASGMAAPIASPVASRAGRGEGPLSRSRARFARLPFCRHFYATPNSKQDQGGLRHVLYQSRFCVCTRRPR